MQNVGKGGLVSYTEHQWYNNHTKLHKKQFTCSCTKMRDGHAHTYIYTQNRIS